MSALNRQDMQELDEEQDEYEPTEEGTQYIMIIIFYRNR